MIRDYVALDLETSGLNPSENQIIEIGMAKVCDGEITETYSRLLNPKEKLSQRIVELTGITDEKIYGRYTDQIEPYRAAACFGSN